MQRSGIWMTVTSQNYFHEEIKNRLDLGNAYCHGVQNFLSSRLLSKNIKIKISKTAFTCCFGLSH